MIGKKQYTPPRIKEIDFSKLKLPATKRRTRMYCNEVCQAKGVSIKRKTASQNELPQRFYK